MDRVGASFEDSVKSISERLKATPLPIQLPIGSESEFVGMVDLIEEKAIIWDQETLGASYHYEDVPADMADEVVPRDRIRRVVFVR